MTATATPLVQIDIVEQLGLVDPTVLVGTFDRPNLVYRVLPRTDAAGQVVRPGVYVCRVEAETKEGERRRSGVVSVAY